MHGGEKKKLLVRHGPAGPCPEVMWMGAKTIKNRRKLCDDAVQEDPAEQGQANAIAFWRSSLK